MLDAVERGDEQAGAGRGEPVEQVAAGVGGPDLLGRDAVDGTGVHAGLEAERRRAGDLVAVQQRVLHGRGAAPGRQQREVQVDPAVHRDVEHRLRDERAVRHDRAAVGRELAQPRLELLVARVDRGQHLDAGRLGPLADRARAQRAAAAGRRVGAGDDGDDLVGAGEQRLERRHRRRRGAGEDEPHGGGAGGVSARARTAGGGWP